MTSIHADGKPLIRTAEDVRALKEELALTRKNRKAYIDAVLKWSFHDPALFNDLIIGRPPYWSKQLEICNAVSKYRTLLVVSGNSVGKSFLQAGLVLWYLYTRPNSIVLTTAPTQTALSKVLWRYIREAHDKALHPLGGKLTSSPYECLELGSNWMALGISTTKTEKLSGFHGDVCCFVDEASGVSPEVWSALDSLGYQRLIATGNPLRAADNRFYADCQKAMLPGSKMGLLKISSMMSPDIDKETSSVGLACKSWLETCREKYGEGTSWWKSHVLAEFPDEDSETLFKREWLDASCGAKHVVGGPKRLAIDVAEGAGRDHAFISVRDDNGLYWLEGSNKWDFEDQAARVARLCREYEIDGSRVTFDSTGTGSAFGHFLQGQGITGARGFRGAFGAGKKDVGINLRTNAAWSAARRMDPNRTVEVVVPPENTDGPVFRQGELTVQRKRVRQPIFAIPEKFMDQLRPELSQLRYSETATGKISLESGEAFRDRLGRSPNASDSFFQSFAYSC